MAKINLVKSAIVAEVGLSMATIVIGIGRGYCESQGILIGDNLECIADYGPAFIQGAAGILIGTPPGLLIGLATSTSFFKNKILEGIVTGTMVGAGIGLATGVTKGIIEYNLGYFIGNMIGYINK